MHIIYIYENIGKESGTYEDNLGLIQLPLDFQQLISLCWVLKITKSRNT